VRTPAFEQLQIVEQRLLTRTNMLDIARRLDVLPDLTKMNPDEIVAAMRARTSISTSSQRQQEAPLMTVTFEAPRARTAAEVLNEYLTLIQQQDTEFRRGRAGETLQFFVQEVKQLGEKLDAQSARILEFKQTNTDALPESLDFRLSQQALLQERLSQTGRDLDALQRQRERLVQLFEQTGKVETQDTVVSLTPNQQRLIDLQDQLDQALAIYSPENPRVTILKARIEQLKTSIATAASVPDRTSAADPVTTSALSVLDVQLAEVDSRLAVLSEQKSNIETQLERLTDSIQRTPEVAITLEELNRKYASIQLQYNAADDRLSKAQTGDRIETRSRGQRISVIEQPAVPSQPTKPNRILIAGGGSAFGVLAGLALILLLEILNTTARRPEDLVKRFDITPFTTIPYIRTRQQTFFQRSLKLLLILIILIGIPAVIYAIHTYYLPLDLIADKVMNKIGVRTVEEASSSGICGDSTSRSIRLT
jgi:uncharacterized protein involved in exopolysaccharide biosynthesis